MFPFPFPYRAAGSLVVRALGSALFVNREVPEHIVRVRGCYPGGSELPEHIEREKVSNAT